MLTNLYNLNNGDTLKYECTKYLTSLMETTVLEFGQLGMFCDMKLALPSTPLDHYRHEAIMQRYRMGLPNWKPSMPSKFSSYSRLRLFWPTQDQRLNSNWECDVAQGADVGYWISESKYDRLGHRTIVCFWT